MKYPWGDGPLSYSLLKLLDPDLGSPAEFLHACKAEHKPTDAMRLGTCTHWHLLGGPPERKPLVYTASKTTGEGAVKNWKAYQAEHAGEEIFGAAEWNKGAEIAHAVRSAPHSAPVATWLDEEGHEYEVALSWEMGGIPFATRGVDVLLPRSRRLADVKKCSSVRRYLLDRQCHSLRYPEQLVVYEAAVRACRFDPAGSAVLAVCEEAPYVSLVLPLGAAARATATARVGRWLALLRSCLDADLWPGPEGWELEPPAWDVAVTGEDELPVGVA